MSEPLPVDIETGDAYALRTFDVKDDRLASIAVGTGHWEDGVCVAICTQKPDDPDHIVPVEGCHCGVYAYWTIGELVERYSELSRHIVTVVRLGGETIEGDNGVKAGSAQIVAWWCAEDAPEHIAACEASIPTTREDANRGEVVVRRFYDRDVMIRMYPPPAPAERNRHG
jgi:hypothetical protein